MGDQQVLPGLASRGPGMVCRVLALCIGKSSGYATYKNRMYLSADTENPSP